MENGFLEFTEEISVPVGDKLAPRGWARSPLISFDRMAVSLPNRLLLRESDTYIFGNERVTAAVSVSDNGLSGEIAACIFDAESGTQRSVSRKVTMPLGRMDMPQSAQRGDVIYRAKDASVDFIRSPGKRYVRLHIDKFDDVRTLYINVMLADPTAEQISTLSPADSAAGHFRLREVICDMPASGRIVLGADCFELAADSAVGILERQRAVEASAQQSICLAACGSCKGHRLAVTVENRGKTSLGAVIFDGSAFPAGCVEMTQQGEHWLVVSHDGRLKMCIMPTAVRTDKLPAPFKGMVRLACFGQFDAEYSHYGEELQFRSMTGFFRQQVKKC